MAIKVKNKLHPEQVILILNGQIVFFVHQLQLPSHIAQPYIVHHFGSVAVLLGIFNPKGKGALLQPDIDVNKRVEAAFAGAVLECILDKRIFGQKTKRK